VQIIIAVVYSSLGSRKVSGPSTLGSSKTLTGAYIIKAYHNKESLTIGYS